MKSLSHFRSRSYTEPFRQKLTGFWILIAALLLPVHLSYWRRDGLRHGVGARNYVPKKGVPVKKFVFFETYAGSFIAPIQRRHTPNLYISYVCSTGNKYYELVYNKIIYAILNAPSNAHLYIKSLRWWFPLLVLAAFQTFTTSRLCRIGLRDLANEHNTRRVPTLCDTSATRWLS